MTYVCNIHTVGFRYVFSLTLATGTAVLLRRQLFRQGQRIVFVHDLQEVSILTRISCTSSDSDLVDIKEIVKVLTLDRKKWAKK